MFEQNIIMLLFAVVPPFLWKSKMFTLKCLHRAMCFVEAVVMRIESSWHWNCFWAPYRSPFAGGFSVFLSLPNQWSTSEEDSTRRTSVIQCLPRTFC